MNKENMKHQALYMAAMGIAFGLYQVNASLKAHVQSCEEASKNVRRVLWLVLSAVVGELVVKLIGLVHISS